MCSALDQYARDHGDDYPPSDGDELGIKGADNLYVLLTAPGPRGAPGYLQPIQAQPNGAHPMFLDAWNGPIRYFHHSDYRNQAPNRQSFRLISDGANGVFENGASGSDDIVNWDRDNPK